MTAAPRAPRAPPAAGKPAAARPPKARKGRRGRGGWLDATLRSPRAWAGVLVTVLLLADLGGADLFGELPPWIGGEDDATPLFEEAWDGGGPLLVFADDLTEAAALHFQQNGVPGYYAGVPGTGEGPERWRHEPLRWGPETFEGDGWHHDAAGAGAWAFGSADGSYPAGSHAAVVSPVIDLRSVPRLRQDVDVEANTGIPVLTSVVVQGTGIAVDEAYQLVAPGGQVDQEHTVKRSNAVLRLAHAYGFATDGGELLDGGRVEVAFQGADGVWGEWAPLVPTRDRLVVGGDGVSADVVAAGLYADATLTPEGEGDAAAYLANDQFTVQSARLYLDGEPSPDSLRLEDYDPTPPWAYQGPVPAADGRGGPWDGFAGSSGGAVTSVFDLSPYAGAVVRLRFVTATALSSIGAPSIPGLGWHLARLDVTAAGPAGIDGILPIAPTDGALLPPGEDVRPALVVQNRAREPGTAHVTFELSGPGVNATSTTAVEVGVDVEGRRLVKAPDTLEDLGAGEPGVYSLRVEVSGPTDIPGIATNLFPWERTFHFAIGDGGGWRATSVRLEREDPIGGPRFLFRGEEATIVAELQNRGTTPIEDLRVAGTGAVLAPRMVDLFGREVGTMLPSRTALDLPVSREVAGHLGVADDRVAMSWTWSGSDESQPLFLVLRRADGAQLAEGGRFLVEATDPPYLQWDYANRDQPDGCQRNVQAFGRVGVVVCPAGSNYTTAERPVDSFVARSPDALLEVAANGTLKVAVEVLANAPGAEWETLASATLSGGPGWRSDKVPLPALPVGLARIRLEGVGAGGAADFLHLEADGATVARETFDAFLQPRSNDVRPSLDATAVHLDGRDNATRLPDTDAPAQNVTVGGRHTVHLGDDGQYGADMDLEGPRRVRLENGDVTVEQQPTGTTSAFYPQGSSLAFPGGRLHEDASLAWDQDVLLQGVRPVLTFNHWLDVRQGYAQVEVSTSGAGGPWQAVATFSGQSPEAATAPVRVPLDGFAGQQVRFRFVLLHEPSTDVSSLGAGWLVEHVRLAFDGLAGATVVAFDKDPRVLGGSVVDALPGPPAGILEGSSHATVRFTRPAHCVSPGGRPDTRAAGPALVTDPIDLTTATAPELRLRHFGAFGKLYVPAYRQETKVDIEYQVLRDDGTWSAWSLASPATFAGARLPADPATGMPGLPIKSGDLYPFIFRPGDDQTAKDPIPPATEPLETVWDLSNLAGETVRLQLKAWMAMRPEGSVYSYFPDYCMPVVTGADPFLDWHVESLELREDRHVSDLEVTDVRLVPDDLPRLQVLDPSTVHPALDGRFVDLQGSAVTGHGVGQVAVTVRNVGLIQVSPAVDVTVQPIPGVPGDALPSLRPVVDAGAGAPLDRDQERTILFQVDTSRSAARTYKLEAHAAIADAADTNRSNDFGGLDLHVLPVRAIGLDRAKSSVQPAVAPTEEPRTVKATLRNAGNLDERGLTVRADVVRLTGVDTYEPVEGRDLGPRSPATDLVGKRSGTATLNWALPPGSLDGLSSSERYALRLRMDEPPGVAAGTLVLDPSTNPSLPQRELLVPLRIEPTLVDTDFGGVRDTEILPPGGAWQPGGWSAETTVDGAPAEPLWREVDHEAALLASGGFTSGGAWHLPEYSGASEVWSNLTSPWLPAHVVRPDSQAFLNLRYASEVEEGQAQVLVREERGGVPGPWQPLGHVRSGRVAIIVPPDFPQVTGSLFGYGLAQPGHPAPPFTQCTDPAGELPTEDNRCQWGPFPAPRPQDPEWVAALELVLLTLARSGRAEDVALFTTAAGALPGTLPSQPHLDVADPVGGGVHRFQVRSLGQLGLTLHTYGAVLLMGDGLTTTHPERSASLQELGAGHGGFDPAAGLTAAQREARIRHVEQVSAILQAAGDSGVRVVAALGPASAMLAESGLAQGRQVTVWQTKSIPDKFPAGPGYAENLRVDLRSAACGAHPCDPVRHPVQVAGQIQSVPDADAPQNYHYISAQDSRSRALRDFLARGDAVFAHTRNTFYSQSILASPPCSGHPLMRDGMECVVPRSVVLDDTAFPYLLTGSGSGQAGDVVGALQSLLEADGQLPAGTGEWTDLPATLQTPAAGAFHPAAGGTEAFVGERMQVRIAVRSDPFREGHGGFTLGRLQLLGTPQESDAAVEFVAPRDARMYAPGQPFTASVALVNRGLEEVQVDQLAVHVETATCAVPRLPRDLDVTLSGDQARLLPGETTVVALAADLLPNGLFPDCGETPAEVDFEVAHTAADDYAANDADAVTAIGRQLHEVTVTAAQLAPSQAEWDADLPVTVDVTLRNDGTQAEQVNLNVRVQHALAKPCTFDSRATIVACAPDADADKPLPDAPLFTATEFPVLARDQEATVRFTVPAGTLPAGVHEVRVLARVFEGGTTKSSSQEIRLLHLLDEDDPFALPAHVAEEFDGEPTLEARSPGGAYGPRPASGLAVGSYGGNDGLYGEDASTRARDASGSDANLLHGWLLSPGGAPTADGTGATALRWTRSVPRSTPAGGVTWSGSTNASAMGDADFGDDHLVWEPARSDVPGRPPMSLAVFEDPALTFLSSHTASESTAYVVEVQFARRFCESAQARWTCQWRWDWGTDAAMWVPLTPAGLSTPQPEKVTARQWHVQSVGTTDRTIRDVPSNPLAGLPALWGHSSEGAHEAAGSWQRLTYEVDTAQPALALACATLAQLEGDFFVGRDPCRYAKSQASQGGEIPRPVRFRLRAASFGGDLGPMDWRVDQLALTDHRLRFATVAQREVDMLDGTSRTLPFRLVNDGASRDVVEVSAWSMRGTIPGLTVRLGPTAAGAVHPTWTLALDPGQQAIVWANVTIGVDTPFGADARVRAPLIVAATSLLDPTAEASTMLDLTFLRRAYGDLATRRLGIGQDLGTGLARASIDVPVPVTVLARNLGKVPVAAPEGIRARLYVERLDPATLETVSGDWARGADGLPVEDVIGSPEPFRTSGEDAAWRLSWKPAEIGRYRLTAYVNADRVEGLDLPRLLRPELDGTNNLFARELAVGAVPLPDLRLQDLVIRDVGTGEPATALVVGRPYRMEVQAVNNGEGAASNVIIQFQAGAAVFSQAGDDLFPAGPGARRSYRSSIWTPSVPGEDGNVTIAAVLSTDSRLFSVDGRLLEAQLPVHDFSLQPIVLPGRTVLEPGKSTPVIVTVTNVGNRAATPQAVVEGGSALVAARFTKVRALEPGESEGFTLVLNASHALSVDARLPSILLSAGEDPATKVPIPLRLAVGGAGVLHASALPVWSGPGRADLEVVLDNPSNRATKWSLDTVSGPLRAAGPLSNGSTPAFQRTLGTLPVVVQPLPPGQHEATVVLRAVQGGNTTRVTAKVPIVILPEASVEAAFDDDEAAGRRGEPAELLLLVENTGNVPADVRLRPLADAGTATLGGPAEMSLEPGRRVEVPLRVVAGVSDRAYGLVEVHWNEKGQGDVDGTVVSLPWSATFADTALQIVDADLGSLRRGEPSTVRVLVSAAGPATEGEALLVVDRVLQARQEFSIGADGQANVTLAYTPEADGGEALVVVRPLGSDLLPADATFLQVGDAVHVEEAAPSAGEGPLGSLDIPSPGLAVLLLALALVLALARRRRA